MNLNGAVDEVDLPVNDDEAYVHNSWTDSVPVVIHGNGPAKVRKYFLSISFLHRCIFLLEKFELFK
jgi:hypothetical protein